MGAVLLSRPGILIVIAAMGYAIATYLMKATSQSGNYGYIGPIAFALAVAVVAEILLLRRINLGIAYVGIIACETLLVLSVAWLLGEGLSSREWLGGGLVIAGTLMVCAA